MFQRLATFGLGVVVLGFVAAPASVKHHQGEKPEVHHKDGTTTPKPKVKDDRGNHPEPGDNRGVAGHGKDDAPGHK